MESSHDTLESMIGTVAESPEWASGKSAMLGKLRELIDATNKACDAAIDATKRDGRFRNAPVNWSHFGCSSAEFYMNEFGSFGWRTYVEEADPNNQNLIEFISDQLFNAGFEGVTVLTEW